MRNHLVRELEAIASSDERTVLLTGDLGYGVLEGFASSFPARFVNAGIAEQNMTGVAAGLALCGKVAYTYSIGNFNTLRCLEQLRNDVCYPNLDVKLISTAGGFAYGKLGMSHHATEDIAALRSLPNMRVVVPADAAEAIAAMRFAHSVSGPFYLRLARGGEPDVHPGGTIGDIRRPLKLADGNDAAILACGTVVQEAMRATSLLRGDGISASVYSVPTVKPLAVGDVRDIASAVGVMATLEEHNVIGGLGSAVAEALSGMGRHAPLMRFGLQDVFSSAVGSQEHLRSVYGISAEAISEGIRKRIVSREEGRHGRR